MHLGSKSHVNIKRIYNIEGYLVVVIGEYMMNGEGVGTLLELGIPIISGVPEENLSKIRLSCTNSAIFAT
jgi:hypothetical protein